MDNLRARIPIVNDLKPKLRNIEKELEELSDMSDMKSAAIGGNTIRKIYEIDKVPYLNEMEKSTAKLQVKQ